MKIIVISDTHNNQKLLREQMSLDKTYDAIFHLGDYYTDLDTNYDLIEDKKYYHIPGIITLDYLSRNTFPWKKYEILGWNFILVHNVNTAPKNLENIDIVFFGHTHLPTIYKDNDVLFINPGHSKKIYDRGYTASHIMMNLTEKNINIKFITYLGKVFKQIDVSK